MFFLRPVLRCAGLLLCLMLPGHALRRQFAGHLQRAAPPVSQRAPRRVRELSPEPAHKQKPRTIHAGLLFIPY